MRSTESRSGRRRVRELRDGRGAIGSGMPPSVLVIVLDDFGVEWMDFMGLQEKYATTFLGYPRTPFLSSIAAGGVWFDRASAEPTCGPTRCSIQTGAWANETGFTFNMRDPTSALGSTYLDFGFSVSDSFSFLPELIRSQRTNVSTAHFGKWHMCDVYSSQVADTGSGTPPDVNLSDPARYGYQTSKGNLYNVGGAYEWWKIVDGVATDYIEIPGCECLEEAYPSSVNATDAAAWLSARTGPFFAYVAFGPPHAEYTVPPVTMVSDATKFELEDAGIVEAQSFPANSSVNTGTSFLLAWKAAIEATDTAARRVWESIPAKIRANTWLIVTGDNGTVAAGVPSGFSHFKRQVYWGGTRVQMMVRGPGVSRPGRMAKQITHTSDIYATVCDILGVTIPAGVAPHSVSFLPVLQDKVDRENRNALRSSVVVQSAIPVTANSSLWVASQRQRAVFDGRWRLLNVGGTESLHDEETDPLEVTDVISTYPDEAARLRALMTAQVPV